MKALITQSNYIPWKGYFDAINQADVFVIYDTVQYTKRDWRNRNKIKTPQGIQWLTIPVQVAGKFEQSIDETLVAEPDWTKQHWRTLIQNYSRARFFKQLEPTFEKLYLDCHEQKLSEVNFRFIKAVCELLNIKTKIQWSSEFEHTGDKSEKLIQICQSLGVTEYLTGPAAKSYLDESLFNQAAIQVTWLDYSAYPAYNQLYDSFVHEVSIVDLLFNEGDQATQYMKSFN